MGSHLATSSSLVAGGVDVKLDCPYCTQRTTHKCGYGGQQCSECGLFLHEHKEKPDVFVRRMKSTLGFSWNEMGALVGWSGNTVTRYLRDPNDKWRVYEKFRAQWPSIREEHVQ